MTRDIYAYRHVAVESFLDCGGAVRVRPMPGQAYSPTLAVRCSRRLADASIHPAGTRFLLFAKLTDRLGGAPFLYAFHGDLDVVLSPNEAKAFLAEFKRGRI